MSKYYFIFPNCKGIVKQYNETDKWYLKMAGGTHSIPSVNSS